MTPHTLHTVTAQDGAWQGRLVITSEDGYFTDASGNDKGQHYDFTLDAKAPFQYGFGFGSSADFNISYVLTLYQPNQGNAAMFTSKACQFDVSAKGPADPDIRVEPYNGAKCDYTVVPGVGENFTVS